MTQLEFQFEEIAVLPGNQLAARLHKLEVEKLSFMLIEWQMACSKLQGDIVKLRSENFDLKRKLFKKDEA